MNGILEFYYRISLLEIRLLTRDGEGGFTYMDALFLNLVRCTEDCTVSKLAEMLNLTKAAVTIRVNKLVDQGFLVRRTSETDGRVKHLVLSDYLDGKFGEEEDLISDAMISVLSQYTEEEMELFMRMIGSVSRAIGSIDPR